MVVKLRVVVLRISDYDWSVNTIRFMLTSVRVPKMCSNVASVKRVAKSCSVVNWTLRYERHAIGKGSSVLSQAMPVNRRRGSIHLVLHVYDNNVVLAYLNGGSGKMAIH